MKETVDLLKRLIATPSMSRDEGAAADILQQEMLHRGLEVHREGNNLWSVSPDYNPERPTLLLNAHIDTVPPNAAWQHDPFAPTLEGDRLYGLGSNDCGGGLVTLLEVFCQLTKHPQKYNLVYAASAEEEVSGKDGFSRMLPLLPHIDVALVGEPTGMQPATSERGLMVLDVTAKGMAGHAARNEGVNAIYKAMDDMEWFRTFHFPRVSPSLGEVKMNVTIVSAGTKHNCIPDECRFTVDVRVNECYSNQEVLEIICENVKSEVKARSTRLSSSHIDEQHPLIQAAVVMGLVPYGSPTLSDQALMPFPSFKLGPGESARSHTADEYICISELEQAFDTYMQLLDGRELKFE